MVSFITIHKYVIWNKLFFNILFPPVVCRCGRIEGGEGRKPYAYVNLSIINSWRFNTPADFSSKIFPMKTVHFIQKTLYRLHVNEKTLWTIVNIVHYSCKWYSDIMYMHAPCATAGGKEL